MSYELKRQKQVVVRMTDEEFKELNDFILESKLGGADISKNSYILSLIKKDLNLRGATK
jgi:hypothetical protein